MAKDNRLYNLTYLSNTDTLEPAYFGDIGQILKVNGVLFSGKGSNLLLTIDDIGLEDVLIINPTVDEFAEVLRLSDDAGYRLELQKKWVRKAQYIISGMVQQRVWKAWDFECAFCHKKMGEVQLTVDHFMPIELGGANDETNYISACRKCNKQKGNIHPQTWCRMQSKSYSLILEEIKRKERLINWEK